MAEAPRLEEAIEFAENSKRYFATAPPGAHPLA